VAKPAAIAGAIAIAIGGAAIAFAVTRPAAGGMSETQTAAMAGAVARLDGAISAARAAVQARASTLSTYLFVRTAVATDAATAADQVKGGELQFSPENGEVLELGRIVQASQAVEELMVQPAGGMRHAHGGAAGGYADLADDQLVITEVVSGTERPLAGPTDVSSMTRSDQTDNHLEMLCKGSTITARVNGNDVVSVQNADYAQGGMVIGAGAPGAAFEAHFKNLLVTRQ